MKANSKSESRRITHQHHDQQRTGTAQTDLGTVAVIGLGYVGLPLALRANQRGFGVIGIDLDVDHIEAIRRHQAPAFLDEGDRAHMLRHTMDLATDAHAIAGADTIIVCVPTPVSSDHLPDLRPIIHASRQIAPHISRNTLVVVESTVNPGICDELILPLLMEGSGLMPERDFLFAYCPERINPGDSTWDVGSIPRVLGGVGPKSTDRAHALYASIIDAPIKRMRSLKEAEAVKIMENSFRDVNIAFINELAMSFKKLDIDIINVLEGASTKPFGFMPHYPGCGVGGHCIPVDPYYLIAYAKKKNGFQHRFLETARHINNCMPHYTVSLLEQALREKGKSLAGSRIALLGLAYKADVPDLRESPALAIAEELTLKGAVVRTHDPFVPSRSSARTLKDALHNADGAIIATDHDVFAKLIPKDFAQNNIDIVIDGRNCLDKSAFSGTTITYHGIGR